MAIQYSASTYRNDLYAGVATANALLTNLNTTLTAAGWSAATVKAFVTLTVSGQPNNNDTITLAGKVYTFKTIINNSNNGEIFIGVDAATTLSNLKAAINLGAGSGTAYSTNTTLNASLEGGTLISTTLIIEEKVGGFNTPFTCSASMTNASLSGATTTGGGYNFSTATTPQNLNALVYAYNDSGAAAEIAFKCGNLSQTSSATARAFTPNAGPNDIRIIASKYQFFIMVNNSAASSTYSFYGAGVPWIPNFLQGVSITAATNASPIQITAANHGYTTGNSVTIRGVLGNTAANVTNNTITVVDVNNFTIDGIVGNGIYTSGGIVGKVGVQIVEAIWSVGTSSSNPMFRAFMTSANTSYTTLLNGSLVDSAGGHSGSGCLRLAYVQITDSPHTEFEWFNASYLVTEPFMTFGSSDGATGTLNGQLWDMVLIRKSITRDTTGSFDSHNWFNLTDSNSTENTSALIVVP